MKCPICGARLHPGSDRCHDCSCHVRAYATPMEESRPRRERRPRGCLLLPLLVLVPLFAITAFFTFMSLSPRSYREPAVSVEPVPEATLPDSPALESMPIPDADEGCFAIVDQVLYFLPEKWDGGPVLRVPESVDGMTVTALGPGCFAGCTELTTILLPDTLVEIGPEAFSGCKNLRGLYLPETAECIGTDAFAGCLSLEAIYIPGSMYSIEAGCFDDCAGLLYIFYEGSFEDWNALYSGYINPFTTAICLDGSYYHGTGR